MRKWIRESNLIEGIDNETEDLRSEVAWLELQERTWCLGTVIWLHTQLLAKLNPEIAGMVRRHDVQVGQRVAVPWREAYSRMCEWIIRADCHASDETSISLSHILFEKIHPFADGNGRVGRMLMNWQRVRCGFEPLCILASERQAYYQWFRE